MAIDKQTYALAKKYTDSQLMEAGDVTGVKGDAEEEYRAGKVNITPENIGTYSTTQIDTSLGTKVDKVNGKGLSTEDYTTAEKTKLAGISTAANKVEASTTNGNVKINGVETQVYDDAHVAGESLKFTESTLATDNAPYLFRKALSILNASPYVREKLVGDSVAWNQLVQNGNFASTTGWSGYNGTISASNNVLTITSTNSSGTIELYQTLNTVVGRKYFCAFDFDANGNNVKVRVRHPFTSSYVEVNGGKTRISVISTVSTSDNTLNLQVNTLASGSSVKYSNVIFIDLSQAFGTQIADYVYSLESSQAGAGIAWLQFYGFLAKPYYAYNAGSMQSVCADSKVISNDDESVQHTISLGGDTLRGVPKLDANNHLYYDGDTKTPNGVITRKYEVVDLGSFNWNYSSTRQRFANDSAISNIAAPSPSVIPNAVCSKYIVTSRDGIADKCIAINASDNNIWISDSEYTDPTVFKAAMSGVYLIYPLATPTTEQSTPFESPQMIFDGGTEEFIDYSVEQQTRDVAIPVGHETQYMGASEDKFYLPTLPDSDGEFDLTVSVENGCVVDMRWKESVNPSIIQTILANFAPIEQTTATEGHSIGDYLVWDGILVKVIDTITAGDTLVLDTNVERTTVADMLA